MMDRFLEEHMTRKEAAKDLGVSLGTFDRLVKKGQLVAHQLPRQRFRTYYFRRSDVQALRAAREDKSTDIWTVKSLALQALSAARAAENRLAQVFDHLGLNAVPVARDEAGIQHLYAYTLETLTPERVLNPAWVRFWAGSFFSMDEIYLGLVTYHTDDNEPWRRFMDFANDTVRTVEKYSDVLAVSPGLQSAYHYFAAARRHLWYIGYMACRQVHGKKTANAAFNGAKTAVDELMAVLH